MSVGLSSQLHIFLKTKIPISPLTLKNVKKAPLGYFSRFSSRILLQSSKSHSELPMKLARIRLNPSRMRAAMNCRRSSFLSLAHRTSARPASCSSKNSKLHHLVQFQDIISGSPVVTFDCAVSREITRRTERRRDEKTLSVTENY